MAAEVLGWPQSRGWSWCASEGWTFGWHGGCSMGTGRAFLQCGSSCAVQGGKGSWTFSHRPGTGGYHWWGRAGPGQELGGRPGGARPVGSNTRWGEEVCCFLTTHDNTQALPPSWTCVSNLSFLMTLKLGKIKEHLIWSLYFASWKWIIKILCSCQGQASHESVMNILSYFTLVRWGDYCAIRSPNYPITNKKYSWVILAVQNLE